MALSSFEAGHPRVLIPELCRSMYKLGWATGTGGGISIKHEGLVYVAPSGVQKERIASEDLFVLNDQGEVLERPPACTGFTPSACTPLFFNAYHIRNAGACLHSHSLNAMLVTLVFGDEFRCTHLEMIKGIKGHGYTSTLVVPIIENTPHEADLCHSMAEAMRKYPDSTAVLVRRHGVYVWGDTWQSAKTQCECYDYLFAAALEMRKLGIDPALPPPSSNTAQLGQS